MPSYAHLPLLRYVRNEQRRKRRFVPPQVVRNPSSHGAKLQREFDRIQSDAAAQPRIAGIDPALILKIELTGPLDEDAWRRNGFQVLAQNPGNIYVLFASDLELKDFKRKLAAFQRGPADKAPNASLFNTVERASSITEADRLGPRLKAQGLTDIAAIDGRQVFVVDLELWDAPTALDRMVRAKRVEDHIAQAGGEAIGAPYVGSYGLILIRAKVKGTLLKELLRLSEIAVIDIPPLPDLGEENLEGLALGDVPAAAAPEPDAPLIGVIDSGLNAHPLLDGLVTERLSVPDDLGSADQHGHGTRVAGIAAYGDIRECIDTQTFASPVRLISVRVVNQNGGFDDRQKIPEQMRAAITLLAERGCRVINISLGDSHFIPYDGTRASVWAAELDTLVRELDVVLVVSAGNQSSKAPAWGAAEELPVTYPAYLLKPESRLIDPAYAANVITVGALAHGNGLRVDQFDGVGVRAVTAADEPSPLTRSGPGINKAIKPDLADIGGTCLYNGDTGRIVTGYHWESAGIATTSPDYRRALFVTASGTSYAAPRVAYKAALLARQFPEASANMIRCLLGLSATVPSASIARLTPPRAPDKPASPKLHKNVRSIVGYGVADPGRVLSSDDTRVIYVADQHDLPVDQMALYAIPVPKDFCGTKGPRSIRVALAYDPPVRHTRLEYLGVRMSFELIRHLSADQIFERYRKREDQSKPPEFEEAYRCPVDPSTRARETSTLQVAAMKMARNFSMDGDLFHLAVFTHRRWAGEDVIRQSYALAVELLHEGCATLYQSCSNIILTLEQQIDLSA